MRGYLCDEKEMYPDDSDVRNLCSVDCLFCRKTIGRIPKLGRGCSTGDVPMVICVEYGWQTISMENDWSTIYGDGVSVAK